MSEGRDSRRQAGCGDVVGVVGLVMLGLILAVCVGVLRWW
jgi:hypothetical protein